MAKTNDPLTEFLTERAKRAPATPSPGGSYSKEGDCVFFYTEPVESKAERVDDLLTLYRAIDKTHRIVGAQIKGIRKLAEHDLIGFEVKRGGGVEIASLVLATFYRQRPLGVAYDPGVTERYSALLEALRDRTTSLPDRLISLADALKA